MIDMNLSDTKPMDESLATKLDGHRPGHIYFAEPETGTSNGERGLFEMP